MMPISSREFPRLESHPRRLATVLWLLFGLALLTLGIAGRAVAQSGDEDVPHVLILYPYDNFQASSNISGSAARRWLVELSGGKINFYNEFLDLRNLPGRDYPEWTAQDVTEKYAGRKIDLILAVSEESYFFAADFGERFAPGVPVAFCCTPDEMMTISQAERPNVTGLVLDFDVAETLNLARLIQPDLRKVYVIGGKGEIDIAMNDAFRQKLAEYPGGIDIEFLEGLPNTELFALISSLPKDAALLYSLFLVDGDGKSHSSSLEFTEELSRHAVAPAYSVFAPYLERGIVGGYIGTFEDAGNELAELGWRILQGTAPAAIPIHRSRAQKVRIDEAEAKRFGLDLNALPEGTIFLNHIPSLWEQYRGLVIAALVVIALQALMILALTVQTSRRRAAEART